MARTIISYRDTHAIDLAQLAALFLTAGWDRGEDRARLAQQVEGARYIISAWSDEDLVSFARAISDGATKLVGELDLDDQLRIRCDRSTFAEALSFRNTLGPPTLTAEATVSKILNHLKMPSDAPPVARARAPDHVGEQVELGW